MILYNNYNVYVVVKYYYKFMDRKKAKALAESEKKLIPEDNFRVVKCVETFEADEWI